MNPLKISGGFCFSRCVEVLLHLAVSSAVRVFAACEICVRAERKPWLTSWTEQHRHLLKGSDFLSLWFRTKPPLQSSTGLSLGWMARSKRTAFPGEFPSTSSCS